MDFNIDELSKTSEGRITIMKTLANMSDQSDLKDHELLYWAFYHNLRDDDQFNYLTNVGEMQFPAMVRRIPHHRSFINLLVSKQSKRGFPFLIYTSDVNSRQKKYMDMIKNKVDLYMSMLDKKMILVNQQISMIDQQFTQIQQLLGQDPVSEEMAAQQQQMQAELPNIIVEVEMAKEVLNKELLISGEDLKKMDRYYKLEYKDHMDIAAEYMLLKLRRTNNLQKVNLKNFISHIVAGREYYLVDYTPGDRLPVYTPINSVKLTYPSIESVEWVQDGPWCRIEERWSYHEVMKSFGHMLTENEKASLRSYIPSSESRGAFLPTQGTAAIEAQMDHTTKIGYHEFDNGVGIKVVRYYWKAERELRAVQSPNKKQPGKYFTHFIESGKTVIMATDYYYSNAEKKWIHKKNEDEKYSPKEVEVINEAKGDKLALRYIEDRYDGVCINDNIWKSYKSPIQLRSEDNFSRVPLPVVGRTFNGLVDYPYSLIGQTIALVETIEILYYHRELLLALTNVEGVVLDYSQKPKSMTDDEWYYQMKLGRYIIETVKNGQQVSSFNQFQRVGGSSHSIIQYIDNMIANTYNFMGDIMGIPRPSKGQVSPSDQVGTFEMSIDQSNLITEIIYEDHDEIAARALTILANLYATYCLPKGDLITLGGKELDVFKIEPDFFKNIDLECGIEDSVKHERQLQEIKTIIKQRSDVGQIPLQHFISLYMTESIRDLERSVQYFAEEAEKAAAMQFSNNENAKAEAQARMLQLKGEMDQKMELLKADIVGKQRELDMSLESMKLEQKNAVDMAKLAQDKEKIDLERQKMATDAQLKLMELLNEQSIETALIQENRSARIVDQKINALRLKMESLINGVTLELSKKKQKTDHVENMKKLEVEEKKAKKMSVEHVNDN